MIYYYEGKTRWMLGTDKLEEVIQFKKEHHEQDAQDILDFIFFAFHKKSPLARLLPDARKKEAIKSYKLFRDQPEKSNDLFHNEVETWDGVDAILKIFLEYHLTDYERQKNIYLAKVEKYQDKLGNPNATFDEEQEASKALDTFNKQIEKLDMLIAKSEGSGKKTVYKHLFEIQDNHFQALKERGHEK